MTTTLMSADAFAGMTSKPAEALGTKVEAGNKATLKELMAAARKGNKYAQYTLGGIYFTGAELAKGPLQDFYEGAHWIRKAAEQGLVKSGSGHDFSSSG